MSDQPEPQAAGDPEEPVVERAADRRTPSWRARLAIAVVCALLGIGLAVQARLTADVDRDLRGARQEDLVRILDDLDGQHDRLGEEVAELSDTKDQLATGDDQAEAAQQEAQARLDQLEILGGTVAATGPGIQLQITPGADPIPAEALVTVIQELRAAGAEAIQVGPVRIGMSSAVTSQGAAVLVDGQQLSFPLTILAIGDPATLATAMGIPGGAVASVSYAGAEVVLTESDQIQITAVRSPEAPEYAEPAAPS